MTNISEIAKLAGVSRSTVSRVISGNGYVKDEKRRSIQKIMNDLDYTPNQNAIFLKQGKTKTLGLIALSTPEYLSVFMTKFSSIAQNYDYHVKFFLTSGDPAKDIEALDMLRKKQVDGMFILNACNEVKEIEPYTKYGPIVMWQRVYSNTIQSVYMDHYDGFTMALNHVYEQGYRNILPFFGSQKGLNTKARIKAWLEFATKKQLDKKESYIYHYLFDSQDGRKVAQWWLTEQDKTDALLFPTDNVAVGFLAEARKLNIRIPKDVAVMGFNNSEVADLFDLTTIHYPVELQAENAFFLLYNVLNSQNCSLHDLSFKLIRRETT